MKKAQSYNVIGKAELRNDGAEKVTGKALYTVDVDLPGMAHGKILRSPYAHARLVRVDGSKAEMLPGVLAVITREDQKRLRMFGAAYKDQTIVAVDKVRYAGDPVAAVAAVDEATAARALELIEVEYEDLPAVTSIDEALAENAPLVHEAPASGGELMGQRYETPKEFSGSNLCYRFSYANGDVEAGFKKADHVFENTFTFPRVQHFSMEPHATVADFAGDRITLWAGTQEPFTLREHLADIFHLPQSKIRVIVPYVGGGYGGKLAVKTEPLAAVLSWKAKRPVRLAHTIEESFKTVTRHPARVRIKTGVNKDGKLVARQCLIHMETGAYADAGPRVTQKAGYRCFGPYRIPHMKTDAYTVYTNTVPAGAYRGFGTLQVTWAYESQMDIIADKLGFDALEFRIKNLLKKGDLYTPGDTPVDCDLKAGLLQAAEEIGWKQKITKPNRGRGLAVCMKDGGGTYKVSSAAVKMNADGSVVLLTGTVEVGQGARTALSQVCAEELGIPFRSRHRGATGYRDHALRCQYQCQQLHGRNGLVGAARGAGFEAADCPPCRQGSQNQSRTAAAQRRQDRRAEESNSVICRAYAESFLVAFRRARSATAPISRSRAPKPLSARRPISGRSPGARRKWKSIATPARSNYSSMFPWPMLAGRFTRCCAKARTKAAS